jgi:hypothetical protein
LTFLRGSTMYQIDNSSAAAMQPASTTPGTPGFFTDGSAAGGVQPTVVPAEWLNAIQQELLNILTSAGITQAKASFTQIAQAIQSGKLNYAVDTGAANIYAVEYAPVLTALTDGLILSFQALHTNTGASTLNVNGIGAKPILGGAHSALQGNEIVAAGKIEVEWHAGLASFILLEQTGGASQVGPASQSFQAAQLGQVLGKFQDFTSSGNFTAPFTGTYYLSGCAGGGGAGSPNTTSNVIVAGGSGGGSGQQCIRTPVNLTAGQVVPVVIGAAGAFGPVSASSTGGTGGNTQFGAGGSLLNLTGGTGGVAGSGGAPSTSYPGAVGGSGFPHGAYGQDTGPAGPGANGGNGGGCLYGISGPPGRGATGGTAIPGGAISGYGVGGSGAGGFYGTASGSSSTGAIGAAGGQGYLHIEW